MELDALVDTLMDKENFHSMEGRQGVENLCKLVRFLGYKDTQYFGQFAGGAIGDLIEFFEDNSGAIEAVVEWIKNSDVREWKEMLSEEIGEEANEELEEEA